MQRCAAGMVAGTWEAGCVWLLSQRSSDREKDPQSKSPAEGPSRLVTIDDFSIDRTPVTNRQFAKFADETGYLTLAETAPNAELYPDADPKMLQPGSSLFVRPGRLIHLGGPPSVVGILFRYELEASMGSSKRHSRSARSSCGAHRLFGCGSLCPMGGEEFTHRGRMGVRSQGGWIARPSRGETLLPPMAK